jgi:nucleoside triphosphate pyrophosphatase
VIFLASRSPRRREILQALGVPFEVVTPDVEELAEGEPEAVVLENARRKARAGRDLAGAEADLVLGADTEVLLDGRVLGKAADEENARGHLRLLSGRDHEVLGAIVLIDSTGGEREGLARSTVTFHDLDDATLDLYLASGEWRDRAGAYAIQGLGSMLIARLEGDFSNVVGLSVPLLLDLAPELISAHPV